MVYLSMYSKCTIINYDNKFMKSLSKYILCHTNGFCNINVLKNYYPSHILIMFKIEYSYLKVEAFVFNKLKMI